MKYTIELTDEDARLQMILQSEGMFHVLWKYDQWLRNIIKFDNNGDASIERAREKLRDLMHEYSVDLEKVE